ncbi:hypothetical protein [Bacillus bombysepticus]|uniref:hypothetical protein n=1 Tax=Bacillus bombysepticus TaxID=658666 RepID=UPI00301924E9
MSIKTCLKCDDELEGFGLFNKKSILAAAEKFKDSNKEVFQEMKTLALQYSNNKICEHCYLKGLAEQTTKLRKMARIYKTF